MTLGPVATILLSAAVAGGTAAASSFGRDKKSLSAADQAAAQAKQDAENKALMDRQEDEKTNKARRALLDTPTSGFGPNKNLARSFLTSL